MIPDFTVKTSSCITNVSLIYLKLHYLVSKRIYSHIFDICNFKDHMLLGLAVEKFIACHIVYMTLIVFLLTLLEIEIIGYIHRLIGFTEYHVSTGNEW